jgi:hypothetical protein
MHLFLLEHPSVVAVVAENWGGGRETGFVRLC